MTLFGDPTALLLLVVLPALWLVAAHAARQRRLTLSRFGDPDLLGRSSPLPAVTPPRALATWFGLVLLIVALARPQWGREPRMLARTGRDLVVALDLSRSMRVTDVGTQRLRLAKLLAWRLASARAGDRIGLVIFGGAGFLQLPPTSDLGTFQLFLDAASFDDVGDPGTDLAAGIRVAERTLRREGTALGSRAVLLLSDGERSEGALPPLLELLRRARLPVFAVGIGTVEGGRIPADSGSPFGAWHVDNIGRPVVSRLDQEVLQQLGDASGGSYARWDDAPGLDRLSLSLASLEARVLASEPKQDPTERYQWPLALGVLLLLADRWRRRPAARHHVLRPRAAATAILTGLLSCRAGAREAIRGSQLYDQGKYLEAYEAYQTVLRQQGGPELRYNSGNALYRLRQYSEAAKTWRDASQDAPTRLREQAYFNMGNAFVRAAEDANALSGYLERAVDAYEEALRLDPTDQDAKWNLEIALARRGDVGEEGSKGRNGRAQYGRGGHEEGYEASRETAVGAMAGGGQGGDEGESVDQLNEDQARAMLESMERQQLTTHEGKRPPSRGGAERDW
jgi:Ca-activated chloride channel family protein